MFLGDTYVVWRWLASKKLSHIIQTVTKECEIREMVAPFLKEFHQDIELAIFLNNRIKAIQKYLIQIIEGRFSLPSIAAKFIQQ